MPTTREKLEKATADFLTLVEEVNGKEDRNGEDLERLKTVEGEVNSLLALVKADESATIAKDFVDQLAGKAVGNGDEPEVIDGIVNPKGMTLGEAFTKSPAYKDFIDRYARAGGVIPDSVKGIQSAPFTADIQFKDLVTGASATSAGAAVRDDRYAPVTDLIGDRRLTVADLVTTAQTNSDTVEFVRVNAKTSNASPVVEASATTGTSGQKPESALTLEVVSTSVRTIAHWIPITKRAASDAPQVRALIDAFLRQGLAEELEDQMLTGDGTGQNFTGILNTTGINTTAVANDIDAILDAIRLVREDRRNPNAVILHPNNWFDTGFLLAKDTTNNYLIGDPRASADQLNQLWGLRVVVTDAITENTGLVGDFRQAVLFQREGISLTQTDSHSDFFTRNILAVLAEMRAAFAVLDPEGFCTATGLT